MGLLNSTKVKKVPVVCDHCGKAFNIRLITVFVNSSAGDTMTYFKCPTCGMKYNYKKDFNSPKTLKLQDKISKINNVLERGKLIQELRQEKNRLYKHYNK